jgi:hypothetical protein
VWLKLESVSDDSASKEQAAIGINGSGNLRLNDEPKSRLHPNGISPPLSPLSLVSLREQRVQKDTACHSHIQ